jgi:hypothetical protein
MFLPGNSGSEWGVLFLNLTSKVNIYIGYSVILFLVLLIVHKWKGGHMWSLKYTTDQSTHNPWRCSGMSFVAPMKITTSSWPLVELWRTWLVLQMFVCTGLQHTPYLELWVYSVLIALILKMTA